MTWCLLCPISELLLQDESDNCVIGLLGEFAEVPGAVQLCLLLNKPRSNPLKAQLQDNGSRVVSPTSMFHSVLAHTVPLPDGCSALISTELPSLLDAIRLAHSFPCPKEGGQVLDGRALRT